MGLPFRGRNGATVNTTIGDSLEYEALILDGLGSGRDTKIKGDAFAHGRIIPWWSTVFSSF